MIPGTQSRTSEETVASADVVTVKADLVRFTGSTTINTINFPLNVARGGAMFFAVSTSGALTIGTSGNILVGQSLAVNRLYTFVYSSTAAKWYIHGVV